ncbi:MAG: beta-phosphoglucomutase [Cyclobacteriaceae bacterium]|jgi:beta-phosphoglucomutase|nr:beta-phosphoglucomutase [Cyclobacteriaceae bacterium]
MIRACIFDLDGVIVDTAHYHFLAWQRLAQELGVPFSEEDNERLKGVSRMRSLEIILELGNLTLDMATKEELATKKNGWFVDYVNAIRPEEIFPGVKELIHQIKSRGLKVGLASSSKNAQRVIDLLQIESLFDAVVDGTMITHSKPHPEIFLLAAERLGLKPIECVVFEDAEAGVEAALAAGMRCVGVGSPEQLGNAHHIIPRTGQYTLEKLTQLEHLKP